MKMKFLFKLVALMTIISVVGCSDDVGVGPKGKLYFSDSKSWKDSGTLIYENFDPSSSILRVHFSRLKRKLADGCGREILQNIRGKGYWLCEKQS